MEKKVYARFKKLLDEVSQLVGYKCNETDKREAKHITDRLIIKEACLYELASILGLEAETRRYIELMELDCVFGLSTEERKEYNSLRRFLTKKTL